MPVISNHVRQLHELLVVNYNVCYCTFCGSEKGNRKRFGQSVDSTLCLSRKAAAYLSAIATVISLEIPEEDCSVDRGVTCLLGVAFIRQARCGTVRVISRYFSALVVNLSIEIHRQSGRLEEQCIRTNPFGIQPRSG